MRELSPGPGPATLTPVDQPREQTGNRSPKSEKKVSFVGLTPTAEEEEGEEGKGGRGEEEGEERKGGKGEEEGEGGREEEEGKGGRGEEMEVGRGREEGDGGKREGEEAMSIDPSETLPVGIPDMKVRGDGESEEDDVLRGLSGLEGDGFSIATHFVKV